MKRLLPLIAVLVNVTMLPAAHADDSVFVREPFLRLVWRADLPAFCGSDRAQACTGFVGQRLDCSCERSGLAWQIRSHAQFFPVMYLPDVVWVAHERDHIGDIRQAVESHLLLLGLREFDSQSDCQAAAEREMAGFVKLMDQFKLDSNAARHPRLAKLMRSR